MDNQQYTLHIPYTLDWSLSVLFQLLCDTLWFISSVTRVPPHALTSLRLRAPSNQQPLTLWLSASGHDTVIIA